MICFSQNQTFWEGGKYQKSLENQPSDAEEDEPSDASQSLPSPSHLIRAICTDAPGPPASSHASRSSSGDEDIEEENQLKFSVEVVDVDKKNDLDVSPVPSRLDVHFRDEHSVSEVPSMTSGSMDDSASRGKAHSDAKDQLGDGEYSGEWSVQDHSAGEALLGHAAQNQSAGAEGGDKAEGNDQEAHSEDAKDDLGDGEYSGEWSVEDQSAGEGLLNHAVQSRETESGGGSSSHREVIDQEGPVKFTVEVVNADKLADHNSPAPDSPPPDSPQQLSVSEAMPSMTSGSMDDPFLAGLGDDPFLAVLDTNQRVEENSAEQDELGDGEYSGEWSSEGPELLEQKLVFILYSV